MMLFFRVIHRIKKKGSEKAVAIELEQTMTKENNKWIYEAFENGDEIALHSLDVRFPLADAYTDVEFEASTPEEKDRYEASRM
jgi:hypothetical protein